jgi:toxin ParE1/3/4
VTLRLYPEAERELDQAARHYAGIAVPLGHDFLARVNEALQKIRDNPARYPRIAGRPPDAEIRRYVLQRFPYLIFYEVRSGAIEVLSVSHGARRPGFWARRRRRGG